MLINVQLACSNYLHIRTLSESQLTGFKVLLENINTDASITRIEWAAYMLATVRWECAGMWVPIEEYGKGIGKPYGETLSGVDVETGKPYSNAYYGRGFVQLTWKHNYLDMGKRLGVGSLFVLNPALVLEPHYAYQILSVGMVNGVFTGKKLADYLNASCKDYVNARRIINGTDKADAIANFATTFESILTFTD